MSDSPSSTETLVLLLTQHQEPLFRYIFSLVPREADARDILQETSLARYRKFTEYDPARPCRVPKSHPTPRHSTGPLWPFIHSHL